MKIQALACPVLLGLGSRFGEKMSKLNLGLTKRQLNVLEKVWIDEINCSKFPTQIKSKVAKQLYEDGYLDEVSVTLPGAIPVTVKGYQLTHAGRFAYCGSCRDVAEP